MNPKLLIAVPTRGTVRAEWATAFRIQVQPMGMDWGIANFHGWGCDDARNVAVGKAQDEGYEYLLFYDDDIVPVGDQCIVNLANAMQQHSEIDVIGGIYPRRGTPPEPIVIKDSGAGVWWGWQDGKVHPVFMTGTGFTLIRLERLPTAEWYTPPDSGPVRRYFHHEGRTTDDVFFANICKETGRQWYVHGGVIAQQVDLDGTHYDIENARQELALV